MVVFAAYLGGWWFGGLILAAALLAQHEAYHLMEQGGLAPDKPAGLVLGVLTGGWSLIPEAGPVALAVALLWLAASPVRPAIQAPLATFAATITGAIYPTLFLTFMVKLRLESGAAFGDREGFWLTLAVLVLIWATDTFAYYTGKSIGRHALAPSVSPKKTWEGSIGGALGAFAVAVGLKLTVLAFLPWVHLVVVAVICGVVSQLGDLAESKMKRAVGVKDSGTILPGHGGLLDRFDALILAAPLVYLYLAYAARLF